MTYDKYLKTTEWKKKKADRLAFDNWQCGICHASLGEHYETHHINYSHLGNEDIEHDIISICHECHICFHNLWEQSKKWESSPYTHWKDFSLPDTARLCRDYLQDDFICGDGDYNLCSLDTIIGFIDQYFVDRELTVPVRIDEGDIRLFVRNKRYEIYFDAIRADNFELESWLDSRFGKKGIPGGNKKRAEARRFFTKHKPAAMKRIYKENDNINILMKEVAKLCEQQ